MPTKPLDRLMFAQGGLCYFCSVPLSKAEASVEHLVAGARAGSNSDDNCVACCKAINALLGSMSLKEKIKVVLNQKGQFKCPNGHGHAHAPKPVATAALELPSAESTANRISPDTISFVIENLKARGNARPRRMKTLASTIKSLGQLKLNDKQVTVLIEHLRVSRKILIDNDQVVYKL